MKISGKIITGLILILIGVVLMGRTLDLFYVTFGDVFSSILPFLLIGFGVWHILHRRKKENEININVHMDKFNSKMDEFSSKVNNFESKINEKFNEQFDQKTTDFKKDIGEDFQDFEKSSSSDASHKNGKIKYNKFLGDISIDCKGISMQNVEASMTIGDIEIKLHGGIYSDGLNRIIISSFIGDVRIFAPKDIEIFANCSNFIGDIEALGKHSSGIGNSVECQTTNYDTASKKLYIACNNFIGDIKIYSI